MRSDPIAAHFGPAASSPGVVRKKMSASNCPEKVDGGRVYRIVHSGVRVPIPAIASPAAWPPCRAW